MKKQEVYAKIKQAGFWHEITEHEAVYNMDDLAAAVLPYPKDEAKNLFVRDDKKERYYLITVKGEKRVDLKQFKEKQQTRRLSFASAEDLQQILGLLPGSVTPLGLFEDTEHRVEFFLDEAFWEDEGRIGIHPCENTATLWMKTEDLAAWIQQNGHEVHRISLDFA